MAECGEHQDATEALCAAACGELCECVLGAQYFWGSWGQHEPTRDRKLLLTKRELRHLRQAVKEKGLTIVATKLFINENGLAKLVIALARGKKIYDKRATIKEKDLRRELDRGE